MSRIIEWSCPACGWDHETEVEIDPGEPSSWYYPGSGPSVSYEQPERCLSEPAATQEDEEEPCPYRAGFDGEALDKIYIQIEERALEPDDPPEPDYSDYEEYPDHYHYGPDY